MKMNTLTKKVSSLNIVNQTTQIYSFSFISGKGKILDSGPKNYRKTTYDHKYIDKQSKTKLCQVKV